MKIFKVSSNKLILSDPCYVIKDKAVIPAMNGNWAVIVEHDRHYVSRVTAYHIDSAIDDISLSDEVRYAAALPYMFPVDSGQFGYFDYSGYRNDDIIEGLPIGDFDKQDEVGDKWYNVCCHATCDTQHHTGVFPFGVVVSSGYGDGSYKTRGIVNTNGEYIALSTEFIDLNPRYGCDADDDDDDDEYYEEDYELEEFEDEE